MKRLLLILLFCATILAGSQCLWAEENSMMPQQIKDFVASQPTDVFKERLGQAKEQMLKEQIPKEQIPKEVESSSAISVESRPLNLDKDKDVFINPFISKIPGTVQPTSTDNDNPEIIPTTPHSTKRPVEPPPQFIVSGLIWNSKNPQAIINATVVSLGDRVSNWVVSEITKDGVRMTFEQQGLWVKPIVNPQGGPQVQATNSYGRK